ncbi:MAG: tyrosine--tRNA ligase [Patescibacteria group bacterium]
MTKDPEKISDLLARGVSEIIDKKNVEKKLASGKKLRVKLGIDPTGYDLHIGHAAPLLKLKAFQGLGHQVVLIIGDYTARIGDPSGLDKTRPQLTENETEKFGEEYFKQACLILDKNKTEVRWQSEWFEEFDLQTIINLTSKATLAQILAHETFSKRLKKGLPLSTHEILYPFLQGYDSVAVKADIELGAVEQKFNLLMGRTIQAAFNQPSQDIMTLNYVMGTDGRKMGKTFNNYIAIKDPANEMFGKVMSIPDDLIIPYFELATEVPLTKIKEIKIALAKGDNPRDHKARLAREIVALYHGIKGADEAEKEFNKVFKDKNLPSDILALKLKKSKLKIADLLVMAKLVSSKAEARRLIEQGGFSLNNKKITEWQKEATFNPGDIIRAGKRKFLKIE